MSVLRAGLASLVLSFAFLVSVISGVSSAQAQQTPAAPASPTAGHPAPAAPGAASGQPLNVLVVDTRALRDKSKAANMVSEQLKKKGAEFEKEMRRQEQPLQQEGEALQRQASSLSPETLNQKKRDFERKLREYDRAVQSKRQALQRADSEASEKIEAVILDIISEIVKERKVDLVFQGGRFVVFPQALHVPDQVVQKPNERLHSLSVEIVEQPVANETTAQPATAAAQPGAPPKKKK